jgi:hypothetical protein
MYGWPPRRSLSRPGDGRRRPPVGRPARRTRRRGRGRGRRSSGAVEELHGVGDDPEARAALALTAGPLVEVQATHHGHFPALGQVLATGGGQLVEGDDVDEVGAVGTGAGDGEAEGRRLVLLAIPLRSRAVTGSCVRRGWGWSGGGSPPTVKCSWWVLLRGGPASTGLMPARTDPDAQQRRRRHRRARTRNVVEARSDPCALKRPGRTCADKKPVVPHRRPKDAHRRAVRSAVGAPSPSRLQSASAQGQPAGEHQPPPTDVGPSSHTVGQAGGQRLVSPRTAPRLHRSVTLRR